MTENTTALTGAELVTQLGVVVPEGCDPLDDLTVAELGIVGRQLGCDPYAAVQDKATGLRWEALGRVAWLWAKRRDPRAKLDPILQLTAAQVSALLGLLDDDPTPDDGEDAEPEVVELTGELAENPTAPTPASP